MSMTTPLKKILRRAEEPTLDSTNERNTQLITPSPMSRKRSEEAAAAMQHVIDLESEVNLLRAELMATKSQVVILDGINDHLKSEIGEMKTEHAARLAQTEHDYNILRDENTSVRTDLNTCAAILLGLKARIDAPHKTAISEYAPTTDATEKAAQQFASGADDLLSAPMTSGSTR